MAKKTKKPAYGKPAAKPLGDKQLDNVNGGAAAEPYCITGYGANNACHQGQQATEACEAGGAEKPIKGLKALR